MVVYCRLWERQGWVRHCAVNGDDLACDSHYTVRRAVKMEHVIDGGLMWWRVFQGSGVTLDKSPAFFEP